MLLRVQDKDGRGPFRQGVTKLWCEYNHRLPSVMEDFPDLLDDLRPYHKQGLRIGCGVRGGYDGLKRWFSESEFQKLDTLGYRVVRVKNYVVVCESESQVIFATKKPLKKLLNMFIEPPKEQIQEALI